ncbi:MAG: SBBP repeat-containing protein [Actinomycetota bacterium]|nr:SBBP repeat-containing protein [Actinomycetota bacterium]
MSNRATVLACLALAASLLAVASPGTSVTDPAARRDGNAVGAARLAAGVGRLPLHFEANLGQAGPAVRFLARGPGLSVALSPTAASFDLSGPAGPARVHMGLVGADAGAAQVGHQRLETRVNDYTSPDPGRHLSGIPTYARVVSNDVYPGVDLAWYGWPGELEYDFVVAPGADPARIAVRFEGARSLRLDDGELVLALPGGDLRQRAPVLYQERDGRRRAVAGRFVLDGDTVGFAVGDYDRRRPLVIDPVLAYASFLGGAGDDRATDVAVDGAGNAYVVGTGPRAPWDVVFGAGPSPRSGAALAYHAGTTKAVLFGGRSASGEVLGDTWVFDGTAWAELAVPGPPARAGAGLALEPTTGHLVLFGGEDSAGALGDTWVFDGSAWSQPPALNTSPQPRSAAAMASFQVLGAQGVVLFGGRSASGDLLGDTWVWNGLAWSIRSPAAVPADRAEAAVATDGTGRAHVFGGRGEAGVRNDLWAWSGTTWELQAAGATKVPRARQGAVLVRDDTGALRLLGGRAGTTLLADRWVYRAGDPKPWVKEATTLPGGPGRRSGAAAARHDSAATGLVVGGVGPGGALGDTWVLEAPDAPGLAWVAKLNAKASALKYVTYLGVGMSSGTNSRIRIKVDATGTAYVAGSTGGGNATRGGFTTPGAYQPDCKAAAGCDDVFVVVLSPTGGLRYGTWFGGTEADFLFDMALGPGGTVYVAGSTNSSDLPTTEGALCTTETDCAGVGFVAKLAPAGNGAADLLYATYYHGRVEALAVDGDGVAYLAGWTTSASMPTTPGAYQPACALHHTRGSCSDAFIATVAPAGGGAADLRYATYLGGGCCTVRGAPSQGGNAGDFATAIALGPNGTVYVAGHTGSTDFPTTPGAFDATFDCFSDFGCIGFFVKLRPAGGGAADLLYATYLGSGTADKLTDLAVDASGRAVLVGWTLGENFPVNKAVQKRHAGGANSEAVVAKLDPSLSGDGSGKVSAANPALVFSTYLGGSGGEDGRGVAVDAADNIYAVGSTTSPDFPIVSGAFQSRHAGGVWDGFVAKITGVP